jgi:hypothetical protein
VEPVGVEAEESSGDSDKVASDGGWPGVVVECKTDGRRPAAGSVVMVLHVLDLRDCGAMGSSGPEIDARGKASEPLLERLCKGVISGMAGIDVGYSKGPSSAVGVARRGSGL